MGTGNSPVLSRHPEKQHILYVTGTLADYKRALDLTKDLYDAIYKRGDMMPIAPALEMFHVLGEKITAEDIEATFPVCAGYLASGKVRYVKFVGKTRGDEKLRKLAGEHNVEVVS